MKRLIERLRPGNSKAGLPKSDIDYRCGGIDLVLPAGHGLPVYQQRHPKYDRFLPHLARFVPGKLTVIDVGANCGDTLAAMAQANPDLHYLCVEPDAVFLAYFHRNLERLRASLPNLSAEVIPALVGRKVTAASLSGERGTKHAEPSEQGQRSSLLDDIFAAAVRPTVGLLKSDVDGYDFDVLDSASGITSSQKPVLFFECQYDNAVQLAGFRATLDRLFASGYSHWTVFDNFGEVVVNQAGRDVIEQLMQYVWRQNQGLSTRTIYYLDLLASPPEHMGWVSRALESY